MTWTNPHRASRRMSCWAEARASAPVDIGGVGYRVNTVRSRGHRRFRCWVDQPTRRRVKAVRLTAVTRNLEQSRHVDRSPGPVKPVLTPCGTPHPDLARSPHAHSCELNGSCPPGTTLFVTLATVSTMSRPGVPRNDLEGEDELAQSEEGPRPQLTSMATSPIVG